MSEFVKRKIQELISRRNELERVKKQAELAESFTDTLITTSREEWINNMYDTLSSKTDAEINELHKNRALIKFQPIKLGEIKIG